jgi:hypothetical protein
MELEILKRSLFEAYSAGFEAGMMQNEDIVTAYEKWWQNIMEGLYDWKRSDICPS